MNADNPNLVRAALDGGIFLLDTAHGYQDGRNEEMPGTVVPERKRDSFVLATKVHLSTWIARPGFSPRNPRRGDWGEARHKPQATGARSRRYPSLHNQSMRESVLYQPVLKALERPSARERRVLWAFRPTGMSPR